MTPEMWDYITGTTQADYDMFVFLIILILISWFTANTRRHYIVLPPNRIRKP